MTRPTTKRPRRLPVESLLVVGALVAALGCDVRRLPAIVEGPAATPAGLGTMCSVDTDELAPEFAAINVASGACASRVCVKPAEERATDTAPLCTQVCQNDNDCQGGASRDPQDPMDQRCSTGFTCRAIFPNLAFLPYACQKVCVCKDFVEPSQAPTPPVGCP